MRFEAVQGLYPRVIGAEWSLTAQLEAIIADGIHDGDLRSDTSADLLALAVAGLTDLALAQHWASDGTRPSLAEIPALVLTLLVGPGAQEMGCDTPRRARHPHLDPRPLRKFGHRVPATNPR
jgi:hypothetical protein